MNKGRKRMRLLVILMAVVFMALMPQQVSATDAGVQQENTSEDFVVETIDGEQTLTKYTGTDEVVVIPDGVTVIGSDAFWGNEYIRRVEMPDTVKKIEDCAFVECSNITSVKLSKNLESIEEEAFWACTKLKSITLGKKLKTVRQAVFEDCTSLEKILVEKGNKYFVSKKGVLYSRNMKTLYAYPAARKSVTSYEIPRSVNNVMSNAFDDNLFLKKITVNGIIKKGESVDFTSCESLKKLVFKKPYRGSVYVSWCPKLTTVVLAEGTTKIECQQFVRCKNLRNVNFPSSLKVIETDAFKNCPKIKRSMVPSYVKAAIHKGAFDK